MPANSLPYKQAANVERRTWDKKVYEARSHARVAGMNDASTHVPLSTEERNTTGEKRPAHAISLNDEIEKEEFQKAQPGAQGPLNSQRAYLKPRRGKVDLESKIGSTEIINPDAVATSSATAGEVVNAVSITQGVTQTGVGWHCKVCDCFLKDSATYLDHINGRKHQRHLGFSMRTEKSTTSDVSKRLKALAHSKKSSNRSNIFNGKEANRTDEHEFEELVKEKDNEASKLKAERARKREERKKKKRNQESHDTNHVFDEDMAAMMGFNSFCGN